MSRRRFESVIRHQTFRKYSSIVERGIAGHRFQVRACHRAPTKRTTMLKPCLKCGRDWNQDWELVDTVYPSHRDPITGEFTEWNVVCQIHNTGCGRTVCGASKTEAVERWNRDETDEMSNW